MNGAAPNAARIEIGPGFALPFTQAEHSDPGLNQSLRSLLLARGAEGERYRNSDPTTNVRSGVFESRLGLLQWTGAPVDGLRAFCISALLKTVMDLNGYMQQVMMRLDVRADAWFHITRRGGHFGQHNHPMAGVYCGDASDNRSRHPAAPLSTQAQKADHLSVVGNAPGDALPGRWGAHHVAFNGWFRQKPAKSAGDSA